VQKILKEISEKAILLNEIDFPIDKIKSSWLGAEPVSDLQVVQAEERLGLKLPQEYINFVKISNGFPSVSHTGITFLPIEKINFLKEIDEEIIEIWGENDVLKETSEALKESILVGGLNEEQYFLLIPPMPKVNRWRFWHFAAWTPGEWEFEGIEDYFVKELKFLKEEAKDLTEIKPKRIIDYSLRDTLFKGDWSSVKELAKLLYSEKKVSTYYDLIDLLRIYLICCTILNQYEEAEDFFESLRMKSAQDETTQQILNAFLTASKQKQPIPERFDFYKFSHRTNASSIGQIEEQIKTHRKDLLKPEKKIERAQYELYFLFDYGNTKDFIKVYEANPLISDYLTHLRAAIVYGSINEIKKTNEALIKYWDLMFNYKPFEPLFNNVLLGLLDENFLCKVLLEKTNSRPT
jgi:hypothetical protein